MQGAVRVSAQVAGSGHPATPIFGSMTYRISGLDPSPFAHLIGLSDEELAAHGAIRMIADKRPGFPCRVTLDDGEIGEALLLVKSLFA